MNASTQLRVANPATVRTLVAAAALGVSAVAAVVTAWGTLALLAAAVFGVMSLRKAGRFKALLIAALSAAGVVLVIVTITSIAAATATV